MNELRISLAAYERSGKLQFVYDWQGRRIARHVWQGGNQGAPAFSWAGISALYLAKQIGGKTEDSDKNFHIGLGTLNSATTLRVGGGSAVTGGLPGYVRKAYNNYQANGMWHGRFGAFGSGLFKGSSVSGAINEDHSPDRPRGEWTSMGDPEWPWEDHVSIQRHAASLVSMVAAIDLAGENRQLR